VCIITARQSLSNFSAINSLNHASGAANQGSAICDRNTSGVLASFSKLKMKIMERQSNENS
jgi:hypothetical protein